MGLISYFRDWQPPPEPPERERAPSAGPSFFKMVAAIVVGGWLLYALIQGFGT